MPIPIDVLGVGRTVLIFLIVLGPLVLVHELGHYVTARLFGVRVLEFGFGFPPRLFGVRRGETLYSFNLIPLGGFVKLLGEEDPTEPRSLARQAAWKRFIILSSGSVMNLLLPLVVFTALFMIPQRVPVGDVIIANVVPGSPAAQAGLHPGDRILRLNGKQIEATSEVAFQVQAHRGEEMLWEVQHGQAVVSLRVTPRVSPPEGEGPTGIQVVTGRVRVEDVTRGSRASDMGLRPGDLLLAAGSVGLPSHQAIPQAVEVLKQRGAEELSLLLWRQGEMLELPVPGGPEGLLESLQGAALSTYPDRTVSYPVWQALPKGAAQIWETLVLTRKEVVRWISGETEPELAGPIGIAQISGEVARLGVLPLLSFIAFLSLNLGILNILPIPMLDGGRLLFVVIEWARRGKRVSPQREGLVHLVGFVLLMSIVLLISFYDIMRLIRGESLLP